MNLKIANYKQDDAASNLISVERGIALVVTLLMLSVITFLAVAFLAMTRRDRSAVSASLDIATSQSMSDAALARAQGEIIAQMMGHNDILSYDYMASHNYISSEGYVVKLAQNATNVNYDYYNSGQPFVMGSGTAYWAQNIANLYYDPRPPVFVVTNSDLAHPMTDFRFWVDLNRNGRFETNGYQFPIQDNGLQVLGANEQFFNGEPEWIGVLKYPEVHHSPTNQFIGRYAYMVLPIGKTLDLNYIHNYSKVILGMPSAIGAGNDSDGFSRDEGVGSWELNLAAFLYCLSPTMYSTNLSGLAPASYAEYNYGIANGNANAGQAFNDAAQFLRFRYGSGSLVSQILGPVNNFYNNGALAFTNAIDEFGCFPSLDGPFDNTNYGPGNLSSSPWAASYGETAPYNRVVNESKMNMFYDVQDLFDTSKTGPWFSNNLVAANSRVNSNDRYTFQRLLESIGTSSAPEYGVYVYSNGISTNFITGVPASPPNWLRTKVNLNYDNTAQIQNGPYSPMPTTLTPWSSSLDFFTNAADLLLRSQVYIYTNEYYSPSAPGLGVITNGLVEYTFGITNIPIYNPTNPAISYNENVHRMLQLAANIYQTAHTTNFGTAANPIYRPVVFRPQFQWVPSQNGVSILTIVGYQPVVKDAYSQIAKGFLEITNTSIGLNDNVMGIPWVVAATKYIPSFYEYSCQSRVLYERKVLFQKQGTPTSYQTNLPPAYTNQFYVMAISNIFGMDAWNPYSTPYTGYSSSLSYYLYNTVTVSLTNNSGYGYITNYTYLTPAPVPIPAWQGSLANIQVASSNGFITLFQTNLITVPAGYFSQSLQRWVPFVGPSGSNILTSDLAQTGYPVYNWVLNITNRMVYALLDGQQLVDFVNIGPFGSTLNITNQIISSETGGTSGGPPVGTGSASGGNNFFAIGSATSKSSSPPSSGLLSQIRYNLGSGQDPTYYASIYGGSGGDTSYLFGPDINPSNVVQQTETWVANDPIVHYTVGDLTWPGNTDRTLILSPSFLTSALTNDIGQVSARYTPWPASGPQLANMLFLDPQITSPNFTFNPSNWQFPTNLPTLGWLGRIHRGTPWQTIYFKNDNPNLSTAPYVTWGNSWVNSLGTYPTNDWVIPDLFTTVPNDNAARGLLSVNQTNYAAWAAVFAGVVVPTNATEATVINPTNNVYNLVDSMNGYRASQPNGLFHKIGDILGAPALTSPASNTFITNIFAASSHGYYQYNDEMVERIPQQTLGLLKLGLPQFVIYSWGEALKPKSLYSAVSASPQLNNICTNYEITGEFLSRTVCHVVSDPAAAAPKIVVDSYNIIPSN